MSGDFTRSIASTSDSFLQSAPRFFAIREREGEETQDFQHEICTKSARNPPSARDEDDSVLGGERSQASLPCSLAIEHESCPS
jgi:hypothetical protein